MTARVQVGLTDLHWQLLSCIAVREFRDVRMQAQMFLQTAIEAAATDADHAKIEDIEAALKAFREDAEEEPD